MATTWPSGTLTFVYLDEATDNPADARVELLNTIIKVNSILQSVDPGSTIHTSANEGHLGTAAIDADLLDGQHGSYYRNISNINAGILGVPYGGTGRTTIANNSVLIGNSTSTVKTADPGTAGYVLTSRGPTLQPTFQELPVTTTGKTVISASLTLTGASSQRLVLPCPYNGYVQKICINFWPAISPSIFVSVIAGISTTVGTSGIVLWAPTFSDNNGYCTPTWNQTAERTVSAGYVFIVTMTNTGGNTSTAGVSIALIAS